MATIMSRTRNRSARHIARGLSVASPAEWPNDQLSFERLLDRRGIDSPKERRSLAALWVAGAAILFLDWTGQWATRQGPQDLNDLIAQYDSALDNSKLFYARLTEKMRQGEIDVDQWEREMREAVEDTHHTAALLVFGPLFLQIPQVAELVNGMIARELGFLAGLASDIRNGLVRLDGNIKRRVAMYLTAGRETLWELARMASVGGGYLYEENVYGHAEHCSSSGGREGCIEQSAKGRVPIGTLVPVGERTCLSACKCYLRFYKSLED